MVSEIVSTLIGSIVSTAITKLLSLLENKIENVETADQKLRLLWAGAKRIKGKLPNLIALQDRTYDQGHQRAMMQFCYNVDDLIEEFNQATAVGIIKLADKLNYLLLDLQALEKTMEFPTHSCHRDQKINRKEGLVKVPELLPLPSGRQKDKIHIINMLLARNGVSCSRGVSIVGMVGLGKTTLARSIVDDSQVKDYFKFIKWVFAGCGLDKAKPVELNLLYCFQAGAAVNTLWVLDGLQEDPSDFVCSHLKHGDALLITLHDPRLAASAHTDAYYLKRMPDEGIENLINDKVVPEMLSGADRAFFNIKARSISNKCAGLPLIASILGKKLGNHCRRFNKECRARIIEFEETDLWKLVGHEILEAVSLSFDLRSVAPQWNKLMYFSLFPHDYSISMDTLVQLWMAEGFIQYEEWTSRALAEGQFDDILPLSILLPGSDQLPEKPPSTYQTNKITHGLAEFVACNMCLRMDIDQLFMADIDHVPRHLSLCFQDIPEPLLDQIATRFNRLRTLLLLHQNGTNISGVPSNLFQQLLHLRVLDLSKSAIKSVSSSIRNLKQLRYLDLSYTNITSVPHPICELVGLVILKLNGCSRLQQLPNRIGRLVDLVCLELKQTSCRPKRLGRLTRLQIFHAFSVQRTKGYHIAELRDLNSLQGSLKVSQLENVKDGNEAAKALLHQKSGLRSLSLEWTLLMPAPSPLAVTEDVLNNLKPHHNLLQLSATNYRGVEFPSWISSPSCYVQSIYLHNCPNCTKLPPFWTLPCLQTLHIEAMHQVQSLDRDFFGDLTCSKRFQSLKDLELCNMRALGEFGGLEAGDMACLECLKFEGCPVLSAA